MSRAGKLARFTVSTIVLVACALVAQRQTFTRADVSDVSASAAQSPAPDLMFKLAKGAWRARTDVPYVTFNLRERYTWRGRIHDTWWTAYYRNADRDLVLHPMIVPQDEAERLKGFPINLKLSFHRGLANADSLDTNPAADAFPILEPLIEPNGSFGMIARDRGASLVGYATASPVPAAVQPAHARTPAPLASSSALPQEKPLRELAHVEAVARDYTIAFSGTERLATGDAYHLTLTPLRDPQINRLRDIWIDPVTYATVRLSVQGLFEGKPYDGARWIVTYVPFGMRYYIQDIRSADPLHFGVDRIVTGLEYDFVAYDFPSTIPDSLFAHLL